jgi:DNA-binding LytR/AlgR family response regulator
VAAEAVARRSPPVEASAIIAEDEKALLDELCCHLAVLWPSLRFVATAADGVDPRLAERVRRLQGRIHQSPPWTIDQFKAVAQSLRPRPYLTWIKASAGADVKLIMVSDVCYFRADMKYTTVATSEREHIIRRPIKDLVAELDPSQFWRVHRSTIVNVAAINAVGRDSAGGMVLKLKDRPERLSVSEAHRHLFRHM